MKKLQRRIFILAAMNIVMICMCYMKYRETSMTTKMIEDSVESETKITENKGKIAITFDDGPIPGYTEKLLDGLQKRKVRATFFVTGKHAAESPELIKRMQEEGHLIGNHTYSHLQLTKKNEKEFIEEIKETNAVIKEITGETTTYVRPPYGLWNKRCDEELSMFPVLWTVDPRDWCTSNADKIVCRVVGKVQENDIILMHDGYDPSVLAALEIIDTLQEQGYEFVTVDEILFD